MGTQYFPVRKATEGKQQPGENCKECILIALNRKMVALCALFGRALCPGHMVDKMKVSE